MPFTGRGRAEDHSDQNIRNAAAVQCSGGLSGGRAATICARQASNAPQEARRFAVTLTRRLCEPFRRMHCVRFPANFEIRAPQIVLRLGITLHRCGFHPAKTGTVVGLDAITVQVHDSQVALGPGIACLGRDSVQLNGAFRRASSARAGLVAHCQVDGRYDMSSTSGLCVPTSRRPPVAGDAFPLIEAEAHKVLCMGDAGLCSD